MATVSMNTSGVEVGVVVVVVVLNFLRGRRRKGAGTRGSFVLIHRLHYLSFPALNAMAILIPMIAIRALLS